MARTAARRTDQQLRYRHAQSAWYKKDRTRWNRDGRTRRTGKRVWRRVVQYFQQRFVRACLVRWRYRSKLVLSVFRSREEVQNADPRFADDPYLGTSAAPMPAPQNIYPPAPYYGDRRQSYHSQSQESQMHHSYSQHSLPPAPLNSHPSGNLGEYNEEEQERLERCTTNRSRY